MMQKLLFLLLIVLLVYSCQSREIKSYQEEVIIATDTLYIEQIKIETH